jgi:hypothetical protein
VFSEHGFVFVRLGAGDSSGGRFASAEFRRADRAFEFHFRFSLGMVTYRLGSESVSHEEYMCSVLGKPNLSRYPGFAIDPLDAFRACEMTCKATAKSSWKVRTMHFCAG